MSSTDPPPPSKNHPKSEHEEVPVLKIQYLAVMPQPGLHPAISPIHIGVAGLIAFIAASLWPPILLIVSIVLALIAPSLFFENDSAEGRRRLYKLFLKHGDFPEAMKCKDVDLEESYWRNSRGMLVSH